MDAFLKPEPAVAMPNAGAINGCGMAAGWRHLWFGLGLLLPIAPAMAQTLTGQTSLSLRANAYYDSQSVDLSGDGTSTLSQALSAEDITSGPGGAYGSLQQAWARGEVTPTSIGVYSRAYAYSQNDTTAAATYSASATAAARAIVNTPFLIQGGAPAGSQGTLQATLFVSGSVTVGGGPGSAFYDPRTFTQRDGQAAMYFWATGLNASGCTYYVDAGCLDIRRDYTGDLVNSNNALRPWTLNIPFNFASPSSFRLQMWSTAETSVTVGLDGGFLQYFAESDFEHTLRWGGITAVLDAQGQPVSGWTITSLPGLDLTLAAVPEPQPWMLLSIGLLTLGAVKSARRRWQH